MVKFLKFKGVDVMEENAVTYAEDIVVSTGDDHSERSPEVIAEDIRQCLKRTAQNFIEIGNLLLEAKHKVSHGDWGNWLKDNVSFSRQTAHKFMQVAQRFSNVASTRHFNSAQMFELLPLPKKHTDDFFEEKEKSGIALEKLTEKELRQEVKAWKEKFHSPRKNTENVASEKHSEMFHSIDKFLNDGLALIDNDTFFDTFIEYAKVNPEQAKRNIDKIIHALQSAYNAF